MMKSMSKILSLVMILTLVSSPAAYAGKCNFYKDNQQCKNIESGSADKSGHGAQFCKYLKKSQSTCKWELGTAITYTVLFAACTTACVAQDSVVGSAYGAALIAACNYGTLAASLADTAYGMIMKNKVKQEAAQDAEIIGRDYWVDKWGAGAATSLGLMSSLYTTGALAVAMGKEGAQLMSVSASAGSNGGTQLTTTGGGSKNSENGKGTCISAAMNGIMATMKYINRSKIVKNGQENVEQLKKLENAAGQSGNLIGQQEMSTFTPMDGTGGDPAVIQDMRTSPSIANSEGEIPTTADMASFATAENGKMFATPDADKFKKAFDDLAGFGITPDAIAESLESKGVAGTMEAIAGDNAITDAMSDMIKEAESKLGAPSNALAYESSKSEGGGGKKESSDPFAALLGNRGPAAAGSGGLHEIKFGGFDIWHAGTTQSIFEIVSKKTQDVSSRLK